jgi:hypothetical protein
MMATIDPKFHDEKHALMNQLIAIRDGLEENLMLELDAIMLKVKDAAIEFCPKETGALASSITLDDSGVVSVDDCYGNSISAGDPSIKNPISGKGTDEYALFVHDGHAMPDGSFWEGAPFLTEAMLMYEEEIELAVDRAMADMKSAVQKEWSNYKVPNVTPSSQLHPRTP